MKIHGVVVTYNRIALLKECLHALMNQTLRMDALWVIDNCSTDGTSEWLDHADLGIPLHVVHTATNIGGAGGFSLGTKLAAEAGCDYIWLMDDDTIPHPSALATLASAVAEDGSTGFACSQVLWTDGSQHAMNRCNLVLDKQGHPLSEMVNGVCRQVCRTCSFVSVMVGVKAIRKVGLPIHEFFIWCDDIEYTYRIFQARFDCFYVPQSKVLHKTRLNYFPSIDKAPSEMASRFYYQARNACYLKRKSTNRLWFYISVINKYRLYLHRLKQREDKRNLKDFRKAVARGCMDGLRFNPSIQYLNKK